MVDSVLKNHQPFFIIIGSYRDISIQTHQLFAHFQPVKFWSRGIEPTNSVCTLSGFGIISKLITFKPKNAVFLCFFLHLKSQSCDQ